MREHNQEWFRKQEQRLQEPIGNTKRHYYKKYILLSATLIGALWGIPGLIGMKRRLDRYNSLALDCLSGGRTVTNDGPPGSGKTFTGSNMAYFLAMQRWAQLQRDYITQSTMLAQWVREGNTDKITAFASLKESYEFWKENEPYYIPCLVSSIPLREYGTGRMSYKLTPELLLQAERCPEYTVFFNDESGLLFGGDKSKDASDDAKDIWRFIRHFFDGMAVNTNQDADQNGIFMRRSTDYVNHIFGQTWEMKPAGMLKQLEKSENRYFKRIEKGRLSVKRAEYIGQKLYFKRKYAETIGFRRVRHGITTTSGASIGESEDYILPAIGGVEYDDRCYRNLYKCKDKPLRLEGWDKLVVDGFDRNKYDEMITSGAA